MTTSVLLIHLDDKQLSTAFLFILSIEFTLKKGTAEAYLLIL